MKTVIHFTYEEFMQALEDKKERAQKAISALNKGLITYEEFAHSIQNDFDNYNFIKYYTDFKF